MSYSKVGKQLREHLLNEENLKSLNHWVEFNIGENDANVRNCMFLISIDVPDGAYIVPANEPVTGHGLTRATDEGEKDFETYRYTFTLRALRRGFIERKEIEGIGNTVTIFDFCDKVRNSIDKFFRIALSSYSLYLQDIKYSEIENRQEAEDAELKIRFQVSIEEEVLLEGRT